MLSSKAFNKPWVFLALALIAVFMENCDSDTVRGFRHIMRAKNAAKMVKKFPVKVIRRPVIGYRAEATQIQQIEQVPGRAIVGHSGGYNTAPTGGYGAAVGYGVGQAGNPGTHGLSNVNAGEAQAAVPAGHAYTGGYGAVVQMGGYGGQITLQEGATHQQTLGWKEPEHGHKEHEESKGWGWKGKEEHKEQMGWGWKGKEEHKEQMGWGWKEEKKKEYKHDGKDIIASFIGIKILKVGKYIVVAALGILILVLAAIATAGILVSPLSLPLHAFWIGLLFLIPFCPLFILAFISVALKDILTHLRYEEEEEEDHGWGWTGASERWKRSVIVDQPVWQLHRNIMHAMKKLPDFQNFESSKFI